MDKGAELFEARGHELMARLDHSRDGDMSRLIAIWPDGTVAAKHWSDGRLEGARTFLEAEEMWLDSKEVPL